MHSLHNDIDFHRIKDILRRERLAGYARLRGGYSIPLAGALYWAVLGVLGYRLDLASWAMAAVWGSGLLFPIALGLSKLLRNNLMQDQQATDSVLLPAFIGMLLFWPMLAVAVQDGPESAPLILAIGMSMHWPVIGWSYARTGIYSAHAIVRAVLATFLWFRFPEARLTWLPLSVAFVYLATVIALLVDSNRVRRTHDGWQRAPRP